MKGIKQKHAKGAWTFENFMRTVNQPKVENWMQGRSRGALYAYRLEAVAALSFHDLATMTLSISNEITQLSEK